MFTYKQSTGQLFKDNVLWAVGYSGKDEGKNNPAMQQVHNVGPIPQGKYGIGMPECIVDTFPCPQCGGQSAHKHGPYVLPLTHDPANEMFGRNGFLMHSDNIHKPGSASEGCVILPRGVRNMINQSKDKNLVVEA